MESGMAQQVTPMANQRARRPAPPRNGEQLVLNWSRRGGARQGAGRKKSSRRVPHVKRPQLASRYPVLVTLDVEHDLPNLRSCMRVIRPALFASAKRDGFRLVHFSVQRHHLHLVVEAKDARALSRGIQGLSIRVAKRLNKKLGRKGRVFVDRYHTHILKTPTEVKNALNYVYNNARKHYAQEGRVQDRGWTDPCSSANYFDGWKQLGGRAPPGDAPLPSAHTWLLRVGWRRRGLIDWNAVPSPARKRR